MRSLPSRHNSTTFESLLGLERGRVIARGDLRFADGFRPDVVVALDPFESGLAGLFIAEKYDREFQVHITEDFYDPEFIQRDVVNKWRLRLSAYVLKRTQSVRVSTTTIKEAITKKLI